MRSLNSAFFGVRLSGKGLAHPYARGHRRFAACKAGRAVPRRLRGGKNVFELWQFNIQFHLSLIALAHNKYAYETLSSAMKFLQRAYGQFYWERQRSIISLKHPERHDRILQAMRSRDLEQAKDCLREDIVAFTLF